MPHHPDDPTLDLVPAPDDAPDVDKIATAAPESIESAPVWVIRDIGGAEWAMAQYATAAETVRQLALQKQAWLDRVNEWHRAASKPAERMVEFFGFHLEQFGIQQREQSPRNKKGEPTVKTLALVTGKIATRGTDEQIIVDYPETVIAWAKQTCALLTHADALAGGFVAVDDNGIHPALGVRSWATSNTELGYLVPLSMLGVVKVTETVSLTELRRWCHISDADVAPDGATEPLIVRMPFGPDGDVVPGAHVHPPTVTATVQPAI